jgi:type IV secretory pathway VirB10-like protein
MADPSSRPGTAPVTDRRPTPRGVIPRSAQAWLMAAIAVGMLGIIFIAGRPDPTPLPSSGPGVQPQAPDPDRVREYQERLRIVDARAAQDAQNSTPIPQAQPLPTYEMPPPAPPEDPLAAERRRRDYESLFSGNVVLSRRPASERPDIGQSPATGTPSNTVLPRATAAGGTAPSIDEIADAVVRATARAGAVLAPTLPAMPQPVAEEAPPISRTPFESTLADASAAGPSHRLIEGTVIDTVLTNRLDGGAAAPVNCLVTNPIYSENRQHVLIPAGARILGETKPVQSFGDARLAVAFHRLVMPDGRTYALDDFLGVNQIGDAGLRDRVNQHYWSTFGAAGAVGLISGLAQSLGGLGFGGGDGDRTLVIAGSTSDATAQASLQVMNRFLNRMPTITIREGHRVKVYLTGDLQLPAFRGSGGAAWF